MIEFLTEWGPLAVGMGIYFWLSEKLRERRERKLAEREAQFMAEWTAQRKLRDEEEGNT